MTPAGGLDQASIQPLSYHRTLATSLHLDALTLVTLPRIVHHARLQRHGAVLRLVAARGPGTLWRISS